MTQQIFKTMVFLTAVISMACSVKSEKPMNVLFIAVDDLNDWVGPLGGHPQAKTPNMDRFCKEGSVVFQNAVCPAPVCCPSRSALLSGFMPHKTGVYGNGTNLLDSPVVQTHAMLPEYFSKHGYHSLSRGKIFHQHATEVGADWGQWAFDEYERAIADNRPIQSKLTDQRKGLVNGEKAAGPPPKNRWGALSWGPSEGPLEKTMDYTTAVWAQQQLQKDRDKPFFMAVGITRPHLPWIVPQEFFDLYDLETLQTTEIKLDDFDDIKKPSGKVAFKPKSDYQWVVENDILKEATRAYLASVSYADACLGVIFDGLKESGQADNTIVVIWGDHGYHLGEKLRFQKNTLWREAMRTPLFIRTPGMEQQAKCTRIVNLIDLYPTLIELCGLPEKKLDGRDISPLLKSPDMAWEYPGVMVAANGTSVMTEDWHYCETKSGVREFYDLKNDPMEWTNLIDSSEHADTITKLSGHVVIQRAEAIQGRDAPKKNRKLALDETVGADRELGKLK